MYRGHRIVVVTPAGRQRYMELLFAQLLGYREVVDEYCIWKNTTHAGDIAYFASLAAEHPGFVTVHSLPAGVRVNNNSTICHFFRRCTDPNTVYVRYDDDVVLLDTLDAFKAMLDFRIDHPEYFLVYATIMNNAIVSHLQQRYGALESCTRLASYTCMDKVAWKCPHYAERVHRQVLSLPDLSGFRMPNWKLFYNERVSINCISWLGSEFAAFNGAVGRDEEQWLSVEKPKQLKKQNCIFGGYVVVHYAYGPQRQLLDKTNILQQYSQRAAQVAARVAAPPVAAPVAAQVAAQTESEVAAPVAAQTESQAATVVSKKAPINRAAGRAAAANKARKGVTSATTAKIKNPANKISSAVEVVIPTEAAAVDDGAAAVDGAAADEAAGEAAADEAVADDAGEAAADEGAAGAAILFRS